MLPPVEKNQFKKLLKLCYKSLYGCKEKQISKAQYWRKFIESCHLFEISYKRIAKIQYTLGYVCQYTQISKA